MLAVRAPSFWEQQPYAPVRQIEIEIAIGSEIELELELEVKGKR